MVPLDADNPIKHKRWKHRERGYVVEVLGVTNLGNNRTVKVDRTHSAKKHRTWNQDAFLKEFEPIGRPMRHRSRWSFL